MLYSIWSILLHVLKFIDMYFKPPHTRLDIRLTHFLSDISAYFRFKQGWCFILNGEYNKTAHYVLMCGC